MNFTREQIYTWFKAQVSTYAQMPQVSPSYQAGIIYRPSSVLILLVDRQEQLSVLLTRRSANLLHHAKEISFCGGSWEKQDISMEQTALRETQEEIGITQESIEVFGRFPPYYTYSGFLISPYIGIVQAPINLRIDSREVEEVLEIPLNVICNIRNFQYRLSPLAKHAVKTYFLEYQGYSIWGATAALLYLLSWHLNQLYCRIPIEYK